MPPDLSGTPGPLCCPVCGRLLEEEDAVYFDEELRPVGCGNCLIVCRADRAYQAFLLEGSR